MGCRHAMAKSELDTFTELGLDESVLDVDVDGGGFDVDLCWVRRDPDRKRPAPHLPEANHSLCNASPTGISGSLRAAAQTLGVGVLGVSGGAPHGPTAGDWARRHHVRHGKMVVAVTWAKALVVGPAVLHRLLWSGQLSEMQREMPPRRSARCSRDAAEMQPRRSGDAAEMQRKMPPRCSRDVARDAAEMQPRYSTRCTARCSRDAAEMQPRCS